MAEELGNLGLVGERIYRLLLPLPVLVSTKEEWKRTLSFIVAFPREDQDMAVLRTKSAKGRRGGRRTYGMSYAQGC